MTPWPEELDLGKYDVRLRDVSDALDIYRERLRGHGELIVNSTATLWEMIERMQLSISAIQDQRGRLAMHSLMKHVMGNMAKA